MLGGALCTFLSFQILLCVNVFFLFNLRLDFCLRVIVLHLYIFVLLAGTGAGKFILRRCLGRERKFRLLRGWLRAIGLAKEFANGIDVLAIVLQLIWKLTHPKVVWESLTYPKVACLGGIVKTGLMIELLVAPNTVISSLREATIVEVNRKW